MCIHTHIFIIIIREQSLVLMKIVFAVPSFDEVPCSLFPSAKLFSITLYIYMYLALVCAGRISGFNEGIK